MNHLTKIRLIQNLNEEELKRGITMSGSWHMKYKDSAYVYVGGFSDELTEGDLSIIFSQYGELVDVRIVRDKKTGKSRGFGFIAYEDQRSTILAVDNLNGATVCERQLRVDHVDEYKIPREYWMLDEDQDINVLYSFSFFKDKEVYRPTGPDGLGWGKFRFLSDNDYKILEPYMIKNKAEIDERIFRQSGSKYLMDEDERWEKEFENMVNVQKEEEERLRKEKEEKKAKKKLKKEKKKLKKKEKEEKRKIKHEKQLKEIFEKYGTKAVSQKQNIEYLDEFVEPENIEDDVI